MIACFRIEAYSTCSLVFENLNNIDGGEAYVAGKWYHVAVAMGSSVNSKKSLFVMSGSQPGNARLDEMGFLDRVS